MIDNLPPQPELPPFDEAFPPVEYAPVAPPQTQAPTQTPPPPLVAQAMELGGNVRSESIEPLFHQPFGEAPVSFHTVMFRPSPDGEFHWVTITIRGEDPIVTLDHFSAAVNEAERMGWKAKVASAQAVGSPTMQQTPTAGQPNPPQTNEGASTAPAAGKSDSGTDILHKIIVVPTPKGVKVEFYVGRFNYPMSDSRSSDVIAALFDPELQWKKEHFETPRTFDLANYNYLADWEKIVKKGTKGQPATYYNVMRVHKA